MFLKQEKREMDDFEEEEKKLVVKKNTKVSIFDELRQGPGPDLGPRLNGYEYRVIIGGPAIMGTG